MKISEAAERPAPQCATLSATIAAQYPRVPAGTYGFRQLDGWTLVAAAPCPVCGGRLLWAENGNVPGWRICEACGRSWMCKPAGTQPVKDAYGRVVADIVSVKIEVPQVSWDGDLEDAWTLDEPRDEEAYAIYVEAVTSRGGRATTFDEWQRL